MCYTTIVNDNQKKQIIELCEADKDIGLLYFFGSRARGDVGPMSDYDFAVYFCERNLDIYKKIDLIRKLSDILKTDAIDVVVLNEAVSPELKYAVIVEGKLLFEREPYRVMTEPRILAEYFDFRESLLRFGLTKA